MIILTLNEIKSGWDERSLKKYRKEMERDSHDAIYSQRQPLKPQVQNNQYNPSKWRRNG